MRWLTVIALEIAGFVFVVITGTLLHFAYRWLGESPVAGAFCPVNESVWEHLKLLFFPMLFYSVAEYLSFGRHVESFIGAKTVGILVGMITIVAVFYTYSGIAGTHYLWADILTFIIGVAAAYFISFIILKKGYVIPDCVGVALIAAAACFVVFTFFPPPLALFRDPITGGYGRVL
ncbi:DUF6512 family protein [Acetanaerobacterium elongatum]|uniref:Uncharacterized protein n=1 Tax=Acetanaerobacterium elongatum TaxID=258515 RepID=A0A1G9XGC2_9FIRM|nr:DUF6512 family protein [Acetanaerobacterium elongatum]SDM95581.1 hypothetical protein SAMN05192585_10862 [Acetanaerobacterium elongatum]